MTPRPCLPRHAGATPDGERARRPRGRTRRSGPVAAVAITALATALSAGAVGCAADARPTCERDAITSRAVADLDTFTSWVSRHGVRGVIGEVAWPAGTDAAAWGTLARRWLSAARTGHVQVFVWASAAWWPPDHPAAFYRGEPGSAQVSLAAPQATLFEAALRDGLAGGVGLADGSFGTEAAAGGASYSSTRPGEIGRDYTYPTPATLRFLAARGIRDVRLAVMWERLQPQLRGPLLPGELARVRGVIRAAHDAGLSVVLDVHNYGRYARGAPPGSAPARREVLVLGGPGLSAADLADLWRRLATELRSEPALAGYGLMNEPHDLPGGAPTWEDASREVAAAIRGVDRETALWVGGHHWSGAGAWAQEHPAPWLGTEAEPVFYEAHQYFDRDRQGSYAGSYAEENAAIAQAWTECGPPGG